MYEKPFIHLRTQSSYSLSESAIKIDKLVDLAKSKNMPAVALTDNNNMFGALEFSIKCFNEGIQPIIGTTINLLNLSITKQNVYQNPFQITLIAKNEIGYKNLLKLSSKSHIESNNNTPGLDLNNIYSLKEGLIAYFGGIYNPIINYLKNNKIQKCKELIISLKKEFDSNLFFELQRIDNQLLDKYENDLIDLAVENKITIIASNNVQYPSEDYFEAHDSLICIAEKATITQEKRKRSNTNIYFKSTEEMYKLFNDIPEVLENTYLVALKCNYAPLSKKPQLPKFQTLGQKSEEEDLREKSYTGLDKRFTILGSEMMGKKDKYKKRLEYELNVIVKMGFSGYFLIVSDFIKWAKDNSIPVGPGRGSGAGSVVAWSLTITDLDPIKYGLIFERFLNPERITLPDFDIDFCQERRDEVIDYVSNKYGKNSVAHIITFGTLASRAVVRDLGRVQEIPYNEVDNFAKLIPHNPSNPISLKKSLEIDNSIKKIILNDERINHVVNLGIKLEGLYRHASTHAAGVVISDENIQDSIPLYKDPKTQTITTQFSMKYVELSGQIKFDFLGLTTLTIINKTKNLINKFNSNFDIESIPMDDEKTFNMLSEAKTTGVFQLESAGMKDVLKRLKPDKFEEIIAVVALFRPGPMENIASFCNRKHKLEKINYLHSLLETVLKETYGIIVYQEQVMQIAQILSGYTLGEADILRKAMGKKIPKEMKSQKSKFIDGAIKKGLKSIKASEIFDLVDKFAGYGFNKSHAAGYALIAYQTAYLKTHFPEEFLVSSMNLSISKTENIVMFKKEIDEQNINFLKPDINYSNTEFSIEINNNGKKSIRFALSAIKGVGYNAMDNLVKERDNNGKFSNIIEFISRLKTDVVNKRQLEKLIQSGSFDSIETNRAFLFNNVVNLIGISSNLSQNTYQSSLFNYSDTKSEYIKNLKKFVDWIMLKKLQYELEVIGFYFSNHPLDFYSEEKLKALDINSYNEIITNNKYLKAKLVGSILDIKERTSKDGNKYAFITIADKKNQYELTIFGDVFANYSFLIKEGNLLIFYVDISSNTERGKRLIIKKIEFLDKEIDSKKFEHIIYLNNINVIDKLKDCLIEKRPNKNKISILLKRNNEDIKISLAENFTFNDEYQFNNLLKTNKISKKIFLCN